jgi:carbamoyltransferase
MPSRILGISAFYHDSAAALVVDGRIAAAAQEERFTRKKHDPRFPMLSVRYCLDQAGIKASDLDHVVFYEKPFIKFERLLETYLAFAPSGYQSFRLAVPLWLKEKLFQKRLLRHRLGVAVTVQRSPSEPRGFCVLCVAVRGSRRSDARRGRRMDDNLFRYR